MAREKSVIPIERIAAQIYVIRGESIMLDADLAELYHVETGALVRAMKRNLDRFPEDFAFQLTKEEFDNLRSQTGTSSLGVGDATHPMHSRSKAWRCSQASFVARSPYR